MKYHLLHNIGESPSKESHIASNYHTREQGQQATGILTFDGVYKNVYKNKDILKDKQVILFVMGDYIGGDNSFDTGMPHEQYCTMKELEELQSIGCEIGWHTWSHRDLTKLSLSEIEKEVTPPFPMKKFAYPYGRFDAKIVEAVKRAGFEEAFGVYHTDGTQWTIQRPYL